MKPILVLRPLLVFTALVLCFVFSSCQCAHKPDVGPVEGQDAAAAVIADCPLKNENLDCEVS